MFGFLKKKKPEVQVLTEEDIKELHELERTSYMEKARELVKLRGQAKAKHEIQVINASGEKWTL